MRRYYDVEVDELAGDEEHDHDSAVDEGEPGAAAAAVTIQVATKVRQIDEVHDAGDAGGVPDGSTRRRDR